MMQQSFEPKLKGMLGTVHIYKLLYDHVHV